MLLFIAGMAFLVIVGVIVAVRSKHETSPRPTVAELRRRTGFPARREAACSLLQRSTFVFVSTSSLERRLDHRLEDAEGNEIGSVVQIPRPGKLASNNGRPSRFSTVRVEIRDVDGTPVAGIVRQSGLFVAPVTVLTASRIPVGTVKSEGRRQAVMSDVLGRPLGTIRRTSSRYRVDYAIEDTTGSPIGTISDLDHVAARLEGVTPRRQPAGQPNEHVLEVTALVDPDLRLLMLGAAAAVYLVLQRPYSDNGD